MAPRVVFTTRSDIEASVIVALLDSHGIPSFRISGNPQAMWPMAVNSLGDIQLAVTDEVADEALSIIAGHRADTGAGVVRLRDEFEEIEPPCGVPLQGSWVCSNTRSPTSRVLPKTRRGASPTTSPWSFSATRSSASSWPTCSFTRIPIPTKARSQKSRRRWCRRRRLLAGRRPWHWARTCCWAAARRRPAVGSSRRSWPDAYEALIAAVYLDGGLPAAAAFLDRELRDAIEEGAGQTIVGEDYKSALQERVQALGRSLPEYRVAAESGPDHRKLFTVEAIVGGETLGSGTGKAKKAAEQDAARQALDKLA